VVDVTARRVVIPELAVWSDPGNGKPADEDGE
jgi:hypothetical protein